MKTLFKILAKNVLFYICLFTLCISSILYSFENLYIKYLIDKKVKEYTENISGKAVYCTTTNEVFNSIMDAVRAYGGNESGIRKCCRGEIKTSGTLRNGTRLTWVFLKDYVEINNITMEEFVIQHHYSSFLLD